MSDVRPVREQLRGAAALEGALDAARPVPLVLRSQEAISAESERAIDRAKAAGAEIREISPTQLARLSQARDDAPELLALVGADPRRDLRALMQGARAVWHLVDTAYAGNAGFVIRTAELSGADGVVISASFSHPDRRSVRRIAMRADRFFPVHYVPAERALDEAREAGLRLVCLEDTGAVAPWKIDLTLPSLFVIGSEQDGIPDAILARADAVVKIPMLGVMPSYNLHSAMASVATERVRQLEASGGSETPRQP